MAEAVSNRGDRRGSGNLSPTHREYCGRHALSMGRFLVHGSQLSRQKAGTFLADAELETTDIFGLRNLNTAVRPPGLPGLPIPTTLMIDAYGIVRWKNQSTDYMERSNPGYISAALEEVFNQRPS